MWVLHFVRIARSQSSNLMAISKKKKKVLSENFSANIGLAWKKLWIYMLNKSLLCLFGTFQFWLSCEKERMSSRKEELRSYWEEQHGKISI